MRSVSELLRLACLYAEQDREGFIAAYEGMEDEPACREAIEFLTELRAYRRRRWGRSLSDSLHGLKSASLIDVMKTHYGKSEW